MATLQTFSFNNQAADISNCSAQMRGYLEPLLAPYGQARAVMLRAKFIIAELLNNAVKHSGTSQSILKIEITDDGILLISKTDKGAAFDLVGKLQKQDAQLMVSSDAMHLLYAKKKDENVVSFYCKENLTFDLDVSQLAEHLGLLIITKAADEFTYSYQQPVNTFCARLKLC